jgi:transcriptional regulator with XRE-family HTH domain
MTPDDLTTLRKALHLTQADMAERIGMSRRAYLDLEAGKAELRPVHVAAVERVALAVAVERGEPMLAPASIRKDALALARLITEG